MVMDIPYLFYILKLINYINPNPKIKINFYLI